MYSGGLRPGFDGLSPARVELPDRHRISSELDDFRATWDFALSCAYSAAYSVLRSSVPVFVPIRAQSSANLS